MPDPFEALSVLVRETFEGVRPGERYTWFVEGKECLLAIFEEIGHEQASSDFGRGVASIAAHLDHARYYLSNTNGWARGEHPTADWEASWQNQTVDENTWRGLGHSLRADYEEFLGHLAAKPELDQDAFTGALANLGHAAFHLGAVRQLMKFLQ